MGVSLISLGAGASFAQEVKQSSETVTVLGSRIKRINKEGPAPVTTIDAAAIQAGGYATAQDVLRAATQNGGETQGQQSGTGALTTPGASQVDLRGLGPNHTLVMINGRRIADFPMPFRGVSNFVDTSSIPTSMIDKIEILSGSASAVYGSDAIAGVINFNLKRKVDKTTVSYRYGFTEEGGGSSDRLSFSTGYNKDKLNIAFGAEYFNQKPLWGYERKLQDSPNDAPDENYRYGIVIAGQYDRDRYLALDYDYQYYEPPVGTQCDAFKDTLGGSVKNNGYYCASDSAIGLSTIEHGKKSINTFTSATYQLGEGAELFADLQIGQSKTELMRGLPGWTYQDIDGSAVYYYNDAVASTNPDYPGDPVWGTFERTFTPEEIGGIKNAMTRNKVTNFSFTPGIRNDFGNGWNYEAALNYSQSNGEMSLPLIVAQKANAFFLGANLGTELDPEFNAPLSKLYHKLTTAEYNSIAERLVTKSKSWTGGATFQLNNQALMTLPHGNLGFAFVAEADKQGYEINPSSDPSNFGYYTGYGPTSGNGDRTHEALGLEFKGNLIENLELTFATRWDAFQFAGKNISKPTFNLGAEYRPTKSLLFRAAYGTGFRAPDIHYVFAKPDLYHPRVRDIWECRDAGRSNCQTRNTYRYYVLKIREGTEDLKPETSKSLNAGLVFQPNKFFDMSIDYFDTTMKDQVQDMRNSDLLTLEAACRIGTYENGTAIDKNSATCADALSRVVRYDDGTGDIKTLYINPINVSGQYTNGIDISAHLNLPMFGGKMKFGLGHTYTLHHTIVQYKGDAPLNQLAVDSGYYIPNKKYNASAGFEKGPYAFTVTMNTLGRIQNYNGDAFDRPNTKYNANFKWEINDNTSLNFAINNLTNSKPAADPTYVDYPYYDISWFDSVGRAYFIEVSHKF